MERCLGESDRMLHSRNQGNCEEAEDTQSIQTGEETLQSWPQWQSLPTYPKVVGLSPTWVVIFSVFICGDCWGGAASPRKNKVVVFHCLLPRSTAAVEVPYRACSEMSVAVLTHVVSTFTHMKEGCCPRLLAAYWLAAAIRQVAAFS
jgi:hypothetical protein